MQQTQPTTVEETQQITEPSYETQPSYESEETETEPQTDYPAEGTDGNNIPGGADA